MEQGKVQLKPMISDVFPLSEWRQAFELFESRKGLKIILDPKQ
jgi:threonine dehydrogenase-like Zn-dependent dehydrogenase